MTSWDHSWIEKWMYSPGGMERKRSRKDWISVKWEVAWVGLVVIGGVREATWYEAGLLRMKGNDDILTLVNCRARRIGTVPVG